MELIRITKNQAKKLFEKESEFFMQSSKMPLESIWQKAFEVDTAYIKAYKEHKEICDIGVSAFDLMLNNYHAYNCDSERGNIVHFYERRF
jgi:hypothetical protein